MDRLIYYKTYKIHIAIDNALTYSYIMVGAIGNNLRTIYIITLCYDNLGSNHIAIGLADALIFPIFMFDSYAFQWLFYQYMCCMSLSFSRFKDFYIIISSYEF